MDPARRWQVASIVTAAASIGVGAFALQRPSTAEVEPIDLDVVGAPSDGTVSLPTLPLSADNVIVTPDLLDRMPTPPSVGSAVTPVSVTSPEESAPAPTATAPRTSTASPDEPAPSPAPPPRADTDDGRDDRDDDRGDADGAGEAEEVEEPETADAPASVASVASIDS